MGVEGRWERRGGSQDGRGVKERKGVNEMGKEKLEVFDEKGAERREIEEKVLGRGDGEKRG